MDKKQSKFGVRTLLAIVVCIAIAVAAVSGTLLFKASAGVISKDGKYYTDFDTLEEAQEAAAELSLDVASEGDVLLKNGRTSDKKKPLPLAGTERMSVFGVNQDSLASFSGYPLLDAFEDEGFRVNKSLRNYYESIPAPSSTNDYGTEPSTSGFNKGLESSFGNYNDVAVVVVSRGGGEGADLPTMTDENQDADDWHLAPGKDKDGQKKKHLLQLTDSEEALRDYVKAQGFKKIVYLLNSSYPMEMSELQSDDAIDGILWIGRPGQVGTKAAAKILAGQVNPSGKTVDTWYKDFTADPTWYNFGTNQQVGSTNNYMDANGVHTNPDWNTAAGGFGGVDGYFGIDYDEDIYFGYRYYETKAADMEKAEAGTGKAWYKENVVYPFGYGLSYTNFAYSNMSVKLDDNSDISTASKSKFESEAGHEASVKTATASVTVKNTGAVAGKEAVELYVTAPYNNVDAKVEKSHVKLIAFGKTDFLQPNEEQTLEITFNIQDMASYDALGVSGDKGYVLDKGAYTIHAMASSDGWQNTGDSDYQAVTFDMDAAAYLKLDDFSGKEIENLFSKENGMFYTLRDNSGKYQFNKDASANQKLMTRAAGLELPAAPTEAEMTLSDNMLKSLLYWDNFSVGNTVKNWKWKDSAYVEDGEMKDASGKAYVYGDGEVVPGIVEEREGFATDYPWVAETESATARMATWTQKGEYGIMLKEMSGIDPFDTTNKVGGAGQFKDDTGAAAWDIFMNQLSWKELMDLVGSLQKQPLATIGMNALAGNDSAWNYASTFCFTCNTVLAATWNTELSYRQGEMIGDLALLKSPNGNTWWGGSANTHRSPFAGRLFEYTSEDPILGGYISAEEMKGATAKGIVCYMKHCALNDQETNRNGRNLMAWVSEQAIREIYYKPFQMCAQEGESMGEMGAFARAGRSSINVNYNITTELFKNEWGCETLSHTTDNYGGMKKCSPLDLLVRAGTDTIATSTMNGAWDASLNENQGGVAIGTERDDKTGMIKTAGSGTESKVQWYATRKCAMVFLYAHANSSMNANGIDFSGWTAAALNAVQGTELKNVSIAQSTISADKIVYSVSAGKLPDGLTLNADGSITGTPCAAAGEYGFTVKCTADNWVTSTRQYKMNVDSAFTIDYTDGFLGTQFDSKISSSVVSTAAGYKSVSYSVKEGTLPRGMTLAADGMLAGTPAVTGSFPIVVTATAAKDIKEGWSTKTVITEYDYALTLNIAAGTATVTFDTKGGSSVASATVENGTAFAAPAAPTKDGYTFAGWFIDEACTAVYDFGNAVNGNITLYAGWQKAGASVEDLDEAKAELEKVKADLAAAQKALEELKTGKEGGCGSLAGGGVMIVISSILALAAVGFVAFKALKNKNK